MLIALRRVFIFRIFSATGAYLLLRDDMFGVVYLKPEIEKRAAALAEYIIETGGTVRTAAARFGVSKSTVHKDVTERLEEADRELWLRAKAVLERNKAERHLRGGAATREKYKSLTKPQTEAKMEPQS